MAAHLRPGGKPPPPRPRSPEASTASIGGGPGPTCWAPLYPQPARLGGEVGVEGVIGSRGRRNVGIEGVLSERQRWADAGYRGECEREPRVGRGSERVPTGSWSRRRRPWSEGAAIGRRRVSVRDVPRGRRLAGRDETAAPFGTGRPTLGRADRVRARAGTGRAAVGSAQRCACFTSSSARRAAADCCSAGRGIEPGGVGGGEGRDDHRPPGRLVQRRPVSRQLRGGRWRRADVFARRDVRLSHPVGPAAQGPS